MANYLGYPIFDVEPAAPGMFGVQNYGEHRGDFPTRMDFFVHAVGSSLLTLRLDLPTRADRRWLTDFFDDRRGRALPFWMPTLFPIFNVVSDAAPGAGVLQVEDSFDSFGVLGRRRHIYHRAVAQGYEAAEPTLVADGVIEFTVSPLVVHAIDEGTNLEGLVFVRFADDSMKIMSDGVRVSRDETGEMHEVTVVELRFSEMQGTTPTAF